MVLTYHEILRQPSRYSYATQAEEFESHIQFLLESRRGAAQGLFTFDDGHHSHYEVAMPLLEEHRVRGIFFVTAGWVGKRLEQMTWSQLRQLSALGHDVQSHGWSHQFLTRCRPDELSQELW
jgi:peptidoglycan/xylan/chitin deacetylase (PgdA/CDA1 family)